MLFEALTLQLGYNATLVTIGATLLGITAGATGTFLYVGKRALVSDAISHATLPGIGLAFIGMVLFGGDGRDLLGLLLGAALSAWIGLLCVSWLTHRTRLTEDAAIGAVLSVFFGLGIVLLTIIQSMSSGRQAGLESFLLGSTAGMLWNDAMIIAIGGAAVLLLTLLLHRPMSIVAFDPEYATANGINVRRTELAMMGLALAITVVGLKVVGLILIVALLIIPAVAARFWSNQVGKVVAIAAGLGGASGYLGAAWSASAPDLPTGPIIVLIAFGFFVLSLLFAPDRGVLSVFLRHRRFQSRVHVRQGLLALAQGQPIYENLTLRLMRRAGMIRADGVATDAGRAQAARALLDERRWEILRADPRHEWAAAKYDGLTPLETVLTRDQLAEVDKSLGPERV
jgi:manganese/zinc/iron transport system permease protein